MGTRLEFQELLEGILGTSNVYFQEPPSFLMAYPCIKYERTDIDTRFANNKPYSLTDRYTVTVIDSDPDSAIPKKISNLPRSVFDRHYTADNLNHDVFNVYY